MRSDLFTRILALLLITCTLLSCLVLTTSAQGALPEPPELEGVSAAYFYNITAQKSMCELNSDEPVNTSTSAKILMGLVACEMLGDKLDHKITVTSKMLSEVDGISYGFLAGEEVSAVDLLYAAICGSYNDAAYIIAHAISGSTQGFVTLMNSRARELGAIHTAYTNPIGYPDNAAMLTTASDTARIALAAHKNNLYMQICSSTSHVMSPTNAQDERVITTRNSLLYPNTGTYYNKHCSGMNSGYSGELGGWSVVTVASVNGQDYLCVILGGTESDGGDHYAYRAVNKLISWVGNEYQTYKVYSKGTHIGDIKVELTGSDSGTVGYEVAEDVSIYIPTNSEYYNNKVTRSIELVSNSLKAPVKKGDRVGIMKIYYDGECVAKCDLVLSDSRHNNAILSAIDAVADYTQSRAFVITLITLIILLPSVIIFIKMKNRRGSHRNGRIFRG